MGQGDIGSYLYKQSGDQWLKDHRQLEYQVTADPNTGCQQVRCVDPFTHEERVYMTSQIGNYRGRVK